MQDNMKENMSSFKHKLCV